MVIIHGESRSGKTAKALSLLNTKRKSMYFALDFDKSILKLKRENLDIKYVKDCFQIDIEYELMSNGGMINNPISQVVIDPINFLKRKKKETIIDIIEKLRNIEEVFKVEIILVMTDLFHFPEERLSNLEDVVLVKTKNKEFLNFKGKVPVKRIVNSKVS
jgi:hypothetical protein